MAIKIIKHGIKKFIATCPVCGCEFEYECEDVRAACQKQVKCPDCGEWVMHKKIEPQENVSDIAVQNCRKSCSERYADYADCWVKLTDNIRGVSGEANAIAGDAVYVLNTKPCYCSVKDTDWGVDHIQYEDTIINPSSYENVTTVFSDSIKDAVRTNTNYNYTVDIEIEK